MFLCSTQCPKHATCNMCRRSHASLEDEAPQPVAPPPKIQGKAAPPDPETATYVRERKLEEEEDRKARESAAPQPKEPPVSELLPSNSGLAKAHKF